MTIRRIDRGKNHSYEIDGKPALGVTTALSKGLPKPALPNWAARTVAEYVADMDDLGLQAMRAQGRYAMVNALKNAPWAQRDTAAARGTEVHTIAEGLIRGHEIDVPEHLEGYVASAVKFMDEWKPRPLLVEAVVGSYKWMYAGTPDLVAELPDGRRPLFDYKTSRSGIFPETALQLAAYRYADVFVADEVAGVELPMSELGITEAMAVWIRPDGYDVIPLDTSGDVYSAFLHIAYTARKTEVMKNWVHPAVFPDMVTARYGQNDKAEIESLLIGRTVTKVSDDTLLLDDGRRLVLAGNEGGCSCGSGDYDLTELNGVDNVITKVEFVDRPTDDYGYDDECEFRDDGGYYRIFVFAGNQKINLATFEGDDGSGYYGTGYSIQVVAPR